MRESPENQRKASILFKGTQEEFAIDIRTLESEKPASKLTMDDAKNIIIHNAFQSANVKDMARVASSLLNFSGPLYLFLRASFLNHSCVNNCTRIVLDNHVLVYTTRDIQKGQELLVSYVDSL